MTDAGIGHNSLAGDELKTLVERIERLTEEKQALAGDITSVYGEAKGRGFDTRTLRQIVKIRKVDSAQRKEQQDLLDLYLNALGMLD